MAKLLLGKEVNASINEEIKAKVEKLKAQDITPVLGIIRIGEREDDIAYEKGAAKRCETLGVAYEKFLLPADVKEEEVLKTISQVNKNDKIHGVLLFRPLPKHLNEDRIVNTLAVEKDVDGITDRCNLRCRYCMPDGITQVAMSEILTYEEIKKICTLAEELGIRKIKITGGEPLVRKGCVDLIGMIKEIPGIIQVTMTTNGVLLKENLKALKDAGLDGINISLDTLDHEKYYKITGTDACDTVLEAVEASAERNGEHW